MKISISHLAPAAQLAELEWHLKNETDPGIRAVIQAQYEEVHEIIHGQRSPSSEAVDNKNTDGGSAPKD